MRWDSRFFLYRINRLGILWGGRGTGDGKNQLGHWKFDARFNKVDLIRQVEWIALHRSGIRLYNLDTTDLIKTVLPTLPDKTLIYLNSRSFIKGRWLSEGHYSNGINVSTANLIKEHITHKWIVSFDHNQEITNIYKDYSNIIYNINYSARKPYKGNKVIIFSKGLIIPTFKNSFNLKTA